ncbi:Protein N-acetyltransferase, RimJ/RimL family [Paenibacillus sp. yr247]|uniref:GNAT family N-acetyltransferase n=1 Tax=Paenibacillus sp. yr247 TaxID=1761880 RepID=UPI000886328D|nr:GNAT family N-acetyltransferase [Paenibacillus sp. yr247]SDN03488.1 Protein N-acetyltransferase, RimJ/RimL family [Paenibacillus sp. yr247]
MAIIQNIETTLKSGETVIVRSANNHDALSALNIQRSVIAENEYVITTSHEFRNTEFHYQENIQKISENPKELFLVAEVKNEVIGWIIFHTPSLERRSHIGEFGMMISNEWRGRGIGKMLLISLLNWAVEHPSIEKIGLEVFSTNMNAIRLYKNLGFIEEGKRIKQIKIGPNSYIDVIHMYKFVK